jgi:Cof subfamily protein (haloacid dehalogenase superfamily)
VIQMKYAAIVLDLDGTLLNSKKEVSKRTRDAILTCHHYGIRIIYATARPPRTVRWLLPDELIRVGSFVYYNGAFVNCTYSNTLAHFPIPLVESRDILDYCAEHFTTIDIGLEVQDEWYSNKEIDYSVIMNIRGRPIVKAIPELKQCEATKILISGLPDYKRLFEKYSTKLNMILTDNESLLQIMSKKASKENAVQLLCNRYGIRHEEIICFGDDHNDIGLFQVSGYSVAMGNAIKDLKDICNEVTLSNDEDGVARVLERLLG